MAETANVAVEAVAEEAAPVQEAAPAQEVVEAPVAEVEA